MKHSVMVHDNTLYIEKQDNRKWYDYIGIGFNSPKITVYLPADQYGSLSVETSTGDTDIPKNLSFSSINILQSTGSVTLKASATGEVKIKTTTGEIYVEDMSAEALELSVSTGNVTVNDVECKENIKVSVSTGKTTLNQVKCNNLISSGTTGNITIGNVIVNDKISIKRSTGDVKFDNSDAAEIFAQTDTGDVSGTLLSDKIFSAKTDTGKVDVPKSANGGICEVTTDTGNIRLKIN